MKAVLCLFSMIFLAGCSEPRLLLSSGESFPVARYEGQWLLVNYWAVWCKPCVEEIPELNALDKDAKVQVLGFNFDQESGVKLAEQVAALGIEFPLLGGDPVATFEQAPPKGLPATMVINPAGDFDYWLMGPQTELGIKEKLGL